MAVTSHITAPAFGQTVTFAMGLSDRFFQHLSYRKTLRILSGLTAHELTDLGLERATLAQASHKAVYGI